MDDTKIEEGFLWNTRRCIYSLGHNHSKRWCPIIDNVIRGYGVDLFDYFGFNLLFTHTQICVSIFE